MNTRKSALALVAFAVAVLSLAPVTPVEAASPSARYAHAAFKETNEKRANHHRVRLDRNDCLQRFASRHARRMANRERMFHQDLGPILRRCRMRMVGENVAFGYPTGRAVVNRGWMRSSGHRANILKREYRKMGLAARKGGGRWYVAQVFGTRR